jgi:hypothetical protein
MAAAICGARRGEKDLPVLWGLRVEAPGRLATVASALAALNSPPLLDQNSTSARKLAGESTG